jgi:Tol biopolymer transport system component
MPGASDRGESIERERGRRRRLVLGGLLAVALGALAVPASAGVATKTKRVSVSSAGGEANDASYSPSISADRRFVAFRSYATNLVGGDTNGAADVFVRDRRTGKTRRVSLNSAGAEGDGSSYNPSISADGRFVGFQSDATNLVGGDANGASDVFVRDRRTGKTRRVSVSSPGGEGNGGSYDPSISADGRFVAFNSDASNLVGGDTNGATDVFVRDRKTGKTRRVSVSSAGGEGNDASYSPSISADGRFVAFQSFASNLVGGDTNGFTDVFVRNRKTGKTRRVSVSSAGAEGDGGSYHPSISADGRFVALVSSATNLVGGDTNGFSDVFLRNRRRQRTTRVSVSSAGAQGNSGSFLIDPLVVSADGRFVAFISNATNLVSSPTSGEQDFLRDRKAHKTRLLSVSTSGVQADSNSWDPALTPDGRFVAFPSSATNLVGGDTNGYADVFVRGPLR